MEVVYHDTVVDSILKCTDDGSILHLGMMCRVWYNKLYSQMEKIKLRTKSTTVFNTCLEGQDNEHGSIIYITTIYSVLPNLNNIKHGIYTQYWSDNFIKVKHMKGIYHVTGNMVMDKQHDTWVEYKNNIVVKIIEYEYGSIKKIVYRE